MKKLSSGIMRTCFPIRLPKSKRIALVFARIDSSNSFPFSEGKMLRYALATPRSGADAYRTYRNQYHRHSLGLFLENIAQFFLDQTTYLVQSCTFHIVINLFFPYHCQTVAKRKDHFLHPGVFFYFIIKTKYSDGLFI